MRQFLGKFCLALILISPAAQAQKAQAEETLSQQILIADKALENKEYTKVIDTVDPIIASFERTYPPSDKVVSCADDQIQTMILLLSATHDKKGGVVVDPAYCMAYFMKGFALIDLNRMPEAGPFLQKASDFSPLNAHYMNEYAEWHKSNRNWQRSFDLFEKAKGKAEFTGDNLRKEVEARSMRGMGFNLIELGKLDAAEKLFNASLKLVPGNPSALNELQYIKEQRDKLGK